MRTGENAKSAAILREEGRDTGINTSSCELIAESIDDGSVYDSSSRTARHTSLGAIIGKESTRTEYHALSRGIGGIVEERNVAKQLADAGRIVRVYPGCGIVGTIRDAFTSSS